MTKEDLGNIQAVEENVKVREKAQQFADQLLHPSLQIQVPNLATEALSPQSHSTIAKKNLVISCTLG